ncbi:hypothetical protein ACTID9_10980 [Brevibacillus fluminis]|uniref:hypothetical protein n=1 Tax=Brevibacillus fluminis TaxID=511487 RepID=UPI003F8CB5FD
MDSLLDLIFGLLALAGKFWFLILGYVVVRMLGLDKKKKGQSRIPPLTPTTDGGQSGRMTVGQRPDTIPSQPLPAKTTPQPEEWTEGEADWKPIPQAPLTYVEDSGADMQRHVVPSLRDAAPLQTHVTVEPPSAIPKEKLREGMKWAIILSEPRSKAPYRPVQRYKKQ